MDKLWSPWRTQYIESFKNKKETNSCIFCDAVNEKVEDDESLKVYSTDNCFVVLNLYPYNSGHLLVIPNKHTSSIFDLDKNLVSEIMETVKFSIRAIEKVMEPQGFNFGANLGKAAGAGIDEHIHFHIIPRWNSDTNFMPVIGNVKVISQDLLQTKKNLINAFSQILK